jgi:uncharacterized protein (DUF302 family)
MMAIDRQAMDLTGKSGGRAMTTPGLTTLRSALDPKQTAAALAAAISARGLTLFARIDHAAGASAAGLTLRPTELLIFGNAKGGTPLMQNAPTIGIDMPLKALVWQDAAGDTWLGYNDPAWLAERHGIGPEAAATVAAMKAMLHAVTQEAVAAPA